MKNVDIFFAILPEDFNEDFYITQLPFFLQNKINRMTDSKTRKMAIFNKVVLQQILNTNLEHLKYTDYGRPYLKDHPYFNISHSEQWVVCAVAKDIQLGIDVEKLRKINFLALSKRYFHYNEQQLIKNSTDFFHLWTRKEAVLKAQGQGLRSKLKQLDTTQHPVQLDQNYWLFPIDLPVENSICYLAANFHDLHFSLQTFKLSCGY